MDEKEIENGGLFVPKTNWDMILVLLILFANDIKTEKNEKKENEEE